MYACCQVCATCAVSVRGHARALIDEQRATGYIITSREKDKKKARPVRSGEWAILDLNQ